MSRNVVLHRLTATGDAVPAQGNDLRVARGGSEGQQSIAVTTSSAASTNAIGTDTAAVYSTVECFVLAAETPTATVAAGTPIPANTLVRLTGLAATDKLAAIAAAGTGTIYIRPGA